MGIFLQYTCGAGLFKFRQILAVTSTCFLCFISWWKFSTIFKLLNIISQKNIFLLFQTVEADEFKLTCHKISYCRCNFQSCLTMETVQAINQLKNLNSLNIQKFRQLISLPFYWKSSNFIVKEVIIFPVIYVIIS